MCYDISLKYDIPTLEELMPWLKKPKNPKQLSFSQTYHQLGMSFATWPIVVDEGDGPELEEFVWGPVPKRIHKPADLAKQRQFYLNARSEKFLQPRTDWNAIRNQRCLIPVTGFFEYREVLMKKETKKGIKEELTKVCYYISQRDKPFFIAGLWAESMAPVRNEEGKWDYETLVPTKTFTLATREANNSLAQIHNSGEFAGRMPLVLTDSLAMEWVNPNLGDAGIERVISYQAPDSAFEFWPVNSVRKKHENVPDVIDQIHVPDLPPISVS